MRKVANPAPPGDGRDDGESVADLVTEFPGWTIKQVRHHDAARLLWRAARTGPPGHLAVETYSTTMLREVLDELDRIDCRHAVNALRDELRNAGAEAEVYGMTVAVFLPDGTLRGVTAHRGVYAWTSGVLIGTVRDPAAGARAVLLPGAGAPR